jgi:hypothetical protein
MGIIIEESICAQCIHFKRVLIPEMRNCFSLKCSAMDKYIKTPKKTCGRFEPETWEKFLEIPDGGTDED